MTAVGRSATVESECDQFDGRQSQFDPKPTYALLESGHSNRSDDNEVDQPGLLDQQQSALPMGCRVNGVCRFVEPFRLDQPLAVRLVHVKNQYQVFVVEVARSGRMVPRRPSRMAVRA
jgi:hypothetical protein